MKSGIAGYYHVQSRFELENYSLTIDILLFTLECDVEDFDKSSSGILDMDHRNRILAGPPSTRKSGLDIKRSKNPEQRRIRRDT